MENNRFNIHCTFILVALPFSLNSPCLINIVLLHWPLYNNLVLSLLNDILLLFTKYLCIHLSFHFTVLSNEMYTCINCSKEGLTKMLKTCSIVNKMFSIKIIAIAAIWFKRATSLSKLYLIFNSELFISKIQSLYIQKIHKK